MRAVAWLGLRGLSEEASVYLDESRALAAVASHRINVIRPLVLAEDVKALCRAAYERGVTDERERRLRADRRKD